MGVTKVYYIPPLYITLHTALDRYGIRMKAVTSKQPYEADFSINLPDVNNTILLLTDPVWYSGTAINQQVINDIATWQSSTKSLIFIDGSFQYMPWVGSRFEATSQLDPSLTFRLVCPSKQLCIHGYRFSYLLVPESHSRKLAWTYTSVFGPAPVDSIAFAHEAIIAIRDGLIPKQLMNIVSSRYTYMINCGDIISTFLPNCGYFVFAKIQRALPPGYICIDGPYFAQDSYPGYVKLNLLSPHLNIISNAHRICVSNPNVDDQKEIANPL
jgi:aspartate/methionine/tyrosine aminotransferase